MTQSFVINTRTFTCNTYKQDLRFRYSHLRTTLPITRDREINNPKLLKKLKDEIYYIL